MNTKEIIDAFTFVANEKGINKTNLSNIIEELFISIIAKKYGEDNLDKFSVIVNMDRGEIEIFHEKIVVKEKSNNLHEIFIDDALKIDKTLSVDEICIDIIDPNSFGRRLINTAKQFLLQKIKDQEKMYIYDNFSTKVDTVYSGYVHQIQRDRIFIVDDDKNEMVLPRIEQIPNDRFRRGDQIRGLIKAVEYNNRGLEIILSRTDNKFLEKLFELEVPEIEDGIIEIKSIARSPGERSKVCVYSSDRRIDAVGACVGMKGNRIQSIVRELNGENIDIINWSPQPELLISRSLAPSKPIKMFIDEQRPYAVAVFEDVDLPIAIGRNGQNIKLSSSICGYEIDAIKKSDHDLTNSIDILSIDSLSEKFKSILIANNINNTSEYISKDEADLLSIKGLGPKTVEKITDIIKEALS